MIVVNYLLCLTIVLTITYTCSVPTHRVPIIQQEVALVDQYLYSVNS